MKHFLNLSACGLALVLVGCGGGSGSAVRLKGTVQEGDKGVAMDTSKESLRVSVLFKDKDGKDRLESANVGADGAFDIANGPPPGAKVKIAVQHVPAYEKGPPTPSKRFAAFTPEATPLTYEVGREATQEIVVDLSAKAVRKKS